jgi:hypothetical protein
MARQYAKEYAQFHGKPEEIKRRAQRNAARAKMEKAVGSKAISDKDVHHKSGLNNALSNLTVRSKSANRADHK